MAPTIIHSAFTALFLLSSLTLLNAHAVIPVKRANPPTLPSGWTYKGCYVDNLNGRILSTQRPDDAALTIEKCVQACITAGYIVAGAEYSHECFCGNGIANGGKLAASEAECNTNCAGDNTQKCGGGNRLSIYSRGALAVVDPPGPQKTGLPGSWTYQGCITEGPAKRVWKYQIINQNGNTATSCLSQCQKFGYQAAGLEYGSECYCGDVVDIAAAGSTPAPETDCNVKCSGDANYFCGGGNRLTWYKWTGTPLYVWSYPTGAAAGRYELLIGGVCIPLLTTPGVNGKYTFVEKYGTGEPNSTGAYELDLAKLNQPGVGGAWREMHVKTDVFCSASITLPDKGGRQLNVGGWSGDSLFGVRLYWPDGSPGTTSVNDWQENGAELKLQNGRWYPSAMVMSNGSVLIVGGENGSNGPPVPTLEILPKVGGTVFCDWLQRTDPNNLYPFLITLPSGGIFVGYYNEARILDPVTFATTKTLPNIPGNVNDATAGRTYPLEGAAMILPQSAPYTAPLGILICGGSTNGAGIATDNCVSTQPEAANPQWTLERMPSQRVMPCITALPDGTYLILNGAKQGRAGFGLAEIPNLNAVLYNPAKPVNQRMSVLANTTIARLYHSESILMQDGRVLVSGSDPQDGKNPEEYRVEVYVPPYLTAGRARPSFTIANKDWSYGQSVTINVNLPNGGPAKVSLMGAESSTHGNSMGQRTIFPAVSCGGGTCTITAPPNAKVCPPGWFQLFVLDGPTPSSSTWVRIGKDPASLGNWPNYPDFKKPGV
ncbi:MAG: hypothetical protein LQ351_002253 [Letrouitia transgressa]|nr:MAG: hypothetical protein LQ351_002253 [Letrouitia transgressa]